MSLVIGDIHGCLTELEQLVGLLPPDEQLVFLGDYVDRGPQSAGVIAYLQQLSLTRECVFLMGNHEAMMKAAIEHDDQIPFWLINGGEATLDSYGMCSERWRSQHPQKRQLPGFLRFHESLRYYYEDEQSIYVHAGIDLDKPDMADQNPRVLLWVRERFVSNADRWHGKQVFFGHTPTRTLKLPPGDIYRSGKITGIDTGCVYGGHLTAIDSSTLQIFQVPGFTGWPS